MNGFTRPVFGLILAWTLLMGAGCGGSSGGGSAAGTGQVAVLITDGPTDEYERVLITLSSMILIGSGGQQVIYDGEPITFDLLKLRDRADFAFSQTITEGDYSKIRLQVDEVRLVDLGDPADPDDDVEEVLDNLAANGKIDLNPRGPFSVVADKTTVISLDIDAQRSFQVVQTGNSRLKLRPVIFVDVFQDDIVLPNRLIRAFGRVESVDEAAESLVLCDLQFVAALDAPADADNCARVFAGSATHFGADAMTIDFAALAQAIADSDNPLLTAIGFPGIPDDAAPDGVVLDLDAVVNEFGARKTDTDPGWETTDGLVQTDPSTVDCDNMKCVDFLPAGAADPITVQLQTATRVFARDGTELGQGDIAQDVAGAFDGLRVPLGAGEALRASLFVVGPAPGEDLVSGTLTAVAIGDELDVLSVQPETGDPVAVCVTADTDILRILVDGDAVSILDLLDPAVLDPSEDLQVDVAGNDSSMAGCDVDADLVIVE
ncbi:MAG: DUF4382 domain-containing protein [Gammaproteobacteria bacterium]